MKNLILLALLLLPASAFSATTTCGTVSCADSLDGCSVGDGEGSPVVQRPKSSRLENCSSACVTGVLGVASAPDGTLYSYFKTVSRISECQPY